MLESKKKNCIPLNAFEKILVDYVTLDRAKRKWLLCVFFPYMKDLYWLAVNFGIADEVKRKEVQMRLYQDYRRAVGSVQRRGLFY